MIRNLVDRESAVVINPNHVAVVWLSEYGGMVDRENIFVFNLNHVAVVWGTDLPRHLLAPGVRLQIVPLEKR